MPATIITVLLIAAAVVLAIRSLCRQKKAGGCSGCGGNCGGACQGCAPSKGKKP